MKVVWRTSHIWSLLVIAVAHAQTSHRCVRCHVKEVAGYDKVSMAHSLAPAAAVRDLPFATFTQEFSKTKFEVNGTSQKLTRGGETEEAQPAFVIGSGNHAYGFLIQIGNHLYQSPVSYYTRQKLWDVAPGYESDPHPDFSRPVTAECLFCHSGKALPIANTLNTYQPAVFAEYAISCERCHGDVSAHLKAPVPGSILNPAKMAGARRASICEQCHLLGEVRIPNPGKALTDFQPGQTLEDVFTTYLAAQSAGQGIRVVSQSEQLALSLCARRSGDKLWCGTCHNPHDNPAQPAAYYRERCLTCHGATLNASHAAAGRDCVTCHMPKTDAKDGGHSAFTNHRIAATFGAPFVAANTIRPWRPAPVEFAERNQAMAEVNVGLESGKAQLVIRGFRTLNRLAQNAPSDAALQTALGTVFMKAKQPAEAAKCFRLAAAANPAYAPYRVNLASALFSSGEPTQARTQLEKALELDPQLAAARQLIKATNSH